MQSSRLSRSSTLGREAHQLRYLMEQRKAMRAVAQGSHFIMQNAVHNRDKANFHQAKGMFTRAMKNLGVLHGHIAAQKRKVNSLRRRRQGGA